MNCTHDCAQGRVCKCDALLGKIVQTTRDAGCCDFDTLSDRPEGWERAAYWVAVGLGVGFAAALVFFAPAAWVAVKAGVL